MEEAIALTVTLITLITLRTITHANHLRKVTERVYLTRGYTQVVVTLKNKSKYKGYISSATLRTLRKGNTDTNIELEHRRPNQKTLINSRDVESIQQIKPQPSK